MRPTTGMLFIALIFNLFLTPSRPAQAGVLVGSIPAEFDVSSTGAAQYSIPLEAPAGTGGVQPQLSLNYSSQAGNGLLGVGWSLGGLSSIYRCPATLVKDGFIDGVDFDSNDRFCLDGQRLVAIRGAYGADRTEYRTEIDGFSKIVSYQSTGSGPQQFKVWTKAGEVMEYGVTADARINPPLADGTTQAHALSWQLNKVTDSVGNYMTITWFEDQAGGEHYPLKIAYTGNRKQGLSPYNAVEFEYENTSRLFVRYFAGHKLSTSKRLSKVSIKSNGEVVKVYKLQYEQAAYTGVSKLNQITACDGAAKCTSPTRFAWIKSNTSQWQPAAGYTPATIANGGEDNGVRLVDLNGDGLQDMVQHAWWSYANIQKGAWINTGKGWQAAPRYTPPFLIANGPEDYGVRFVDLNGDGLQDVVQSYWWSGRQTNRAAWINNGNGWTYSSQYAPPPVMTNKAYGDGRIDNGVRFIDLNGDGLQDMVQHAWWSNSNIQKGAWLNTGKGWRSVSQYTPPFRIANGSEDYGVRFVDLNGDGLQDVVQSYWWSGRQTNRAAWINNGNGWTYSSQYAPPAVITNKAYGDGRIDNGVRFIDLNGDGLQDMVQHAWWSNSNIQKGAWLNTGKGWRSVSQYTPPFRIANGSEDYGVRFVDLNGDGLQDVMQAYWWSGRQTNAATWMNNGSGWTYTRSYRSPGHITNKANGPGRAYDNGVLFADLNGDGLQDMLQNAWWSSSNIQKGAWLNATAKTDLLAGITNAFGVAIDIKYRSLTDKSVYTKGSAAVYPEQDVQSALYVVSQTRTGNGAGSQNTLNYHYQGAKEHLTGYGFLGFARRTVTDAASGSVVTTDYRQDYPFSGRVSSTQTRLGSRLLSEQINTYASRPTAKRAIKSAITPVFIYPRQTVTRKYDAASGALLTTTTTQTGYDDYGNPTHLAAKTQDANEPSFVINTHNTYANDPGRWHLGRLKSATVSRSLDAGVSAVRRSAFEYDPVSGLLNKEIIEPQSDLTLIRTYRHDGFGNRIRVTVSGADVAARTTLTTYDAQGRFAIKTTNALGHTQKRTYDARGSGRVTQQTGPNGLSTYWTYDSLGRMIEETRADGTQTTVGYAFCNARTACPLLANGQIPAYVVTTASDGAPLSKTYYDVLNRVVLSASESFDGRLVSVQTEYDARGRIQRSSLPYFGPRPDYWTVNTYDTLDRLTQASSPASGITRYRYNGLETTVTNSLSQSLKTRRNSRGQLLWSEDTQGQRVRFSYDAAGNVSAVSDGLHTTTTRYDRRGFKTAMHDPNLGQWHYRHNALGELVSQTDAKGHTTDLTYDLLGRLKTRTEAEGTTTWHYDSALHGIGKLARVDHHGGYQRSQYYDALGRLSQSRTILTSGVYTTETRYDALGRVDEISYPSGFTVKQHYTRRGHLEKVANADHPASVYWRALAMDEFGHTTLFKTGNTLLTARDYENNSGRLSTINTGLGQVQNLSYRYDALGNLTQRQDRRHADNRTQTETFVYDTLNRLTSARVAGLAVQTFSYDGRGNLTHKSDVGDYTYGQHNAGPHAVTATTGRVDARYTYDANGNMQTGNGRSIVWSSYNKPTWISRGHNTVSFSYGPQRARYRQVAGNSSGVQTTIYIDGLYEEVRRGQQIEHRHYISAGAEVIAVYSRYQQAGAERTSGALRDATRFLHRDHLGSIDVVTAGGMHADGEIHERLSFDAFGQRRQIDWQPAGTAIGSLITRGFSGHEQLDSVGLIHMNGRVYDPQLGRFLSADPFVQQVQDYQSLNRYSYARNNPLSYVDPSGFFFKKIKKIIKKVTRTVRRVVRRVSRSVAGLAGRGLSLINSNAITGAIAQVWACSAGGAYGCALYAGASTYAATGSLSAGLKSGVIAFGTVRISGYIGQHVNAHSLSVLAHGAVGGVSARLQGGRFERGFVSAAFVKSVSGRIAAMTAHRPLAGGVAAATLGGTASALSGGKFANGARTFTFLHLITESARYYRSAVGREASALPGENREQTSYDVDPAGRQLPAYESLNVIGLNNPLTGDLVTDLFRQGGLLSKALNVIPAMNATAALHDYWFNSGQLEFSTFNNVGTMLPAGAISVSASVGNLVQGWQSSPIVWYFLTQPYDRGKR